MTNIRPIVPNDSLSLASLHLANLHTPFHGTAGLHLLSFYYSALATDNGGCGFIAQEEDLVLGYVCGVWNSPAVRASLFKHHLIPLTFWGLLQGFVRPSLLISLIRRFKSAPYSQNNSGFELRPIVVSPAVRGSGLAAILVDHLITAARQRGYTEIYLVTEGDNIPANRFYKRFGFCLSGTQWREKILYNRYTISTQNNTY